MARNAARNALPFCEVATRAADSARAAYIRIFRPAALTGSLHNFKKSVVIGGRERKAS